MAKVMKTAFWIAVVGANLPWALPASTPAGDDPAKALAGIASEVGKLCHANASACANAAAEVAKMGFAPPVLPRPASHDTLTPSDLLSKWGFKADRKG